MNDPAIEVDLAIDNLDCLRRSVEDLTSIRRTIRQFAKSRALKAQGKTLAAPKAHELLSACIADLIESCVHLSQGDDFTRLQLSKDLADRIIEEDTK